MTKVEQKAYMRAYYLEHRDVAILQSKANYLAHREERKLQKKAHYLVCKPDVKLQRKKYYSANSERIKLQKKAYYLAHSEEIKAEKKAYRFAHRKEINQYIASRRLQDVQFRLAQNLRLRLRSALKKNYKSGHAVRDLGCTIDELKFYIEGKFTDGMSWNNWSSTGWHLDHVIPLSFFDLTNREQLLQAVHYTNLQPMWAMENIKKSNKILV